MIKSEVNDWLNTSLVFKYVPSFYTHVHVYGLKQEF